MCLSFVYLYPINVITDRAYILCWTLHDPKEGLSILKNKHVSPKAFDLRNFKNAQKKYLKIRELFLYCFTLHKEKMLTDRATIKSKKEEVYYRNGPN